MTVPILQSTKAQLSRVKSLVLPRPMNLDALELQGPAQITSHLGGLPWCPQPSHPWLFQILIVTVI